MSLVEVGLRGEDDVLARHGEATEGFADVLLVRAVRVGVRRVDEVHAEFEGAGDDRLGLVHADHPLVEAGKTFPKLIPPSQSLWIEMPVVPSVVRSMIGPLRAFDSSSAVGRRSSVESPLRAGPAPLPRLGARTPRRAGRIRFRKHRRPHSACGNRSPITCSTSISDQRAQRCVLDPSLRVSSASSSSQESPAASKVRLA